MSGDEMVVERRKEKRKSAMVQKVIKLASG
jgi:hypothetical protein